MLEHVSSATIGSMLGLTFTEYVGYCQTHRKLLQTRYGEARLSASAQDYLVNYPFPLHWVFIGEEENPDTVAILPILKRIVDCTPRFDLYVVPAERDLTHIDQLMEDSDLDEDLSELEFPLLLLLDEEWNLLTSWGPRPEAADGYLVSWLESNPSYEELAVDDSPESQSAYLAMLSELTLVMRSWYNSGLEEICVQEIKALLDVLKEQNASDDVNDFETDFE